ncbi:hypothetical protein [Streptomyces sp. LaPpAH-108]
MTRRRWPRGKTAVLADVSHHALPHTGPAGTTTRRLTAFLPVG